MTTAPTEESVRHEVRSFLAEQWDPELGLLEWRTRLVDAGWAVPSWPVHRLGRGLPAWADPVVADEVRAAGAVGLPLGSGTSLAAPPCSSTVRTSCSAVCCDPRSPVS